MNEEIIAAAQTVYDENGDMAAAIEKALDSLKREWSVPCLDAGPAPCRKIFYDREMAEEAAKREKSVVETRRIERWQPVP